jgi:epoxyqueuosine reductase
VCPWNKKAKAPGPPAFSPRKHLYSPSFEWLCSLSPDSFNRTFKNNPVKRAKLRGLLRNTVIAIGNSGDISLIPLLENASHPAELFVQIHIDWAVRQLKKLY